jgi:hypothetical protein
MWTPELESTWRSRFEVMGNPNHSFHRFVMKMAQYEAIPALRMAIDEIERLRNEKETA